MQACFQAVQNLSSGQYVSEERLLTLCQLPDSAKGQLYRPVQVLLDPMRNDPVVAQLTLKDSQFKGSISLEQLFTNANMENSPEVRTCIYNCECHQVDIIERRPEVYIGGVPLLSRRKLLTLLQPMQLFL